MSVTLKSTIALYYVQFAICWPTAQECYSTERAERKSQSRRAEKSGTWNVSKGVFLKSATTPEIRILDIIGF